MTTTDSSYSKTITILGFAGFVFSGYLSAVKLFTSTCALGETCPYFLGYPSCWYGFALFTILFMTALFGLLRKNRLRIVAGIETIVSFLGVLFAGYFVIPEISNIFSGISTYALGLPTCAYGLVFYLFIFIISICYLRSHTDQIHQL